MTGDDFREDTILFQETMEELARAAAAAAILIESSEWVLETKPQNLGPNEFVLAGKFRITLINKTQ